jgi:hypothetical protein
MGGARIEQAVYFRSCLQGGVEPECDKADQIDVTLPLYCQDGVQNRHRSVQFRLPRQETSRAMANRKTGINYTMAQAKSSEPPKLCLNSQTFDHSGVPPSGALVATDKFVSRSPSFPLLLGDCRYIGVTYLCNQSWVQL